LLPAGAVAGWDLHPLESAAFSRRTPNPDLGSLRTASQSAPIVCIRYSLYNNSGSKIGVFVLAGETNDVREVSPGAPEENATNIQFHTFLDRAVGYLHSHWVFDDPSAAAELAEKCHPLQIQLYAIKVAHAEIVNGGFCQFLFNSSGELAEEAVQGFQNFGLAEVHQLLNEVLSYFDRPISKDRLIRINMLFERFDPGKRAFRNVGDVFALDLDPNIYEMSARFFDPFGDRFYEYTNARDQDRGFYVPTCRFVNDHREVFFKSL
jgi:hypothetical protein